MRKKLELTSQVSSDVYLLIVVFPFTFGWQYKQENRRKNRLLYSRTSCKNCIAASLCESFKINKSKASLYSTEFLKFSCFYVGKLQDMFDKLFVHTLCACLPVHKIVLKRRKILFIFKWVLYTFIFQTLCKKFHS